MIRILGLDVGNKTIGVAVSDAMGWTAQGLTTIQRSHNFHDDLEQLRAIIAEYDVQQIVVGLPRNMNGSLGPQAESVMEFSRTLEERLQLPLELWDERWSTAGAERPLQEARLSRKKRKKVIDKLAAVWILQGYLDAHSLPSRGTDL